MSKADAYRLHVERLAERYDIEIVVGDNISARASRRKRRIKIKPIRGQVTYLVALHEMGHVVGPNPSLRLSQEVEAWKWALDHSVVEPTPASYRSIHRSLVSYSRRQERWASMKRPEDFDRFLEDVAA